MAEAVTTAEDSIIVTILLLSWLILAFTWHISPVFRRSFFRYFASHQFYVKDVFLRHIRTLLPGGSILLQHIFLSGIAFYCIGNHLISYRGRETLFSHYSVLSVFGEGSLAFFIWGAFIAFFVEAISIAWLRFAHPKITYFSQSLNLYPWLLQINLFLATAMVPVYISDAGSLPLYILGVMFLLLFLVAFVVASLDGIKFLPVKQRWRVLSYTTALYILALIGLVIWISLSPRLLNVIALAVSLP